MERLGRDEITVALKALAAELPEGEAVELVVVGGAALVLLYGARETTKDVDAFTLSAGTASAVREAARRVAGRLALPQDWLNDGAKGFVHGMAIGDVILKAGRLTVLTLAPHQLLAMKLSAWRDDVDVADAALLLSRLGDDRDAVWRLVAQHVVPGRELKAQYAFDDLWKARDAG